MSSATLAAPPANAKGHTAEGVTQLAGKYLTFRLSEEQFGLEILKVREIIGLITVTPVPRAPQDVRGVINLRGRIIPVIDLRKKFGMESAPDTERTCIIVVDAACEGDESQAMGVLVDSVSEVLDIRGDDIGPAPSFGAELETDFILGMAKTREGVTILLAVEKVLDHSELAMTRGVVA